MGGQNEIQLVPQNLNTMRTNPDYAYKTGYDTARNNLIGEAQTYQSKKD